MNHVSFKYNAGTHQRPKGGLTHGTQFIMTYSGKIISTVANWIDSEASSASSILARRLLRILMKMNTHSDSK